MSQQQEYIRHIMEYSRRIQALERRNKELVEDLSEARHKIHDLERTEEPAEPVDLCGMPECCAPVDPASVLFYCTQHQSNYDSWTKDD